MQLGISRNPNSYFARLTLLKKLFWLYFLLLIFEGALRKWVAPQLSAPLLVIRDPVSILIIWEAYRTNKWPSRWTVPIVALTVIIIGIFSLQIALGDNPFLVGLYGLRSYLLPFPVIFIMAENFDDEDLRKFGACTMWLLLPTCLLALGQYATPPGSFLNRGAYTGGSQIAYLTGGVRASGTFSFAIGLVEYATFAAAFVFYGMVREDLAKKWLIWASAFALIIIIPTTGQRQLLVQLALVICSVVISAIMGVSQFAKVLRIILPILIVFLLASQLPIFREAMQSMTQRVSGADAVEGGSAETAFTRRAIEPLIGAIEYAGSNENLIGIGLGRGALAVQAFLTGSPDAVTGEEEFSHELMEMGPIAGGAFLLFKALLAIALLGQAVARAREHDPLALLLYPLTFSGLFFALLSQPTLQGFLVISTAFCIAAAKRPKRVPVALSPQMQRQRQALQQLLVRQQAFQRRRMQRD
ncbi:MAG TPA: hypothetical protein VGR47_16890 [Terracidiphilus sp.]|nr:hypothetical protein [Terracidiphilus sp.]